MKKKGVTIDDLAIMVKKGFDETHEEILGVETNVKSELSEMKKEMNKRFDRIENLILEDHKRRLERLEEDMEKLRKILAI